jgi:DNA (cytosine-5)-methyltransferase 1
MVSILGDYSYTIPRPIPLKLKLKDMLEDNVDEKYYLSDKMISFFIHNEEKQREKGNGFTFNVSNGNVIAKTITTRAGSRMDDNFIKIKNATAKGYLEATEGDGIDISSRIEYHRGTVQKSKAQTLTTSGGNDRGICVKGIATNESKEWGKPPLEEMSRTLLANKSNAGVGLIDTNLKIRKLTPRECFRLMGVKDEDINNILKNQSDSSAYHLAGDSICTTCLMALFSQLLDIRWEYKLWNIKNFIKTENT